MPIVPVNRGAPVAPASPAATAAPDTYEVGYGKPPHHSRFRPGQSGNPKGRPKDAKGFKTLIRAEMTRKVRIRSGGTERTVSRAEALLLKAIELASRDNFRATERLLGWYQEAVPDAAPREVAAPQHEELSETDRATLAALRQNIEAELGLAGPAIRVRRRHEGD